MKYIDPKDLHTVWSYVREGLERINQRTPEQYLPEDVYMGIKNGNMHLYVFGNDDSPNGYVVLQLIPGWKGNDMHVFAAYSLDPKVMDSAFDEVKKLAVSTKATRLTFVTKRKGWEKRAKQLGYKFAHTAYALDL